MNISDDDFAVSLVIGTILLVAITVVLVAVIAAVIMGIAGSSSEHKEVGIITTESTARTEVGAQFGASSGSVYYIPLGVVMINTGKDADNLVNLTVTSSVATISYFPVPLIITGSPIGVPLTYMVVFNSADDYASSIPVIITGTFTDGTEQVLYQGQMPVSKISEGKRLGLWQNIEDALVDPNLQVQKNAQDFLTKSPIFQK